MKSIKENERKSCIESKTKEGSCETRLLNPRLGARPRRRVRTQENSQEKGKNNTLRSPASGSQASSQDSPESNPSDNAPTFDKGLEERSDMYNISSWETRGQAPVESYQSLSQECLSFQKFSNVPNTRRSPKRKYRQTQQTIAKVNSSCRYDLKTYQGRGQLENLNKKQTRKHQNELTDRLTGGDGMQLKQSTRRLPSTAGFVKTYASVAAVIPKTLEYLGISNLCDNRD